MKLASVTAGLRTGFGVPLRSPNPNSRAGFGFASKMKRAEFVTRLDAYGWSLNVAAWSGHTRILQHQTILERTPVELTERQRIFLQLLVDGLLDKQIAHEMNISHSGVRKYQMVLAKKLGVSSRTQIMSAAMRSGLVDQREISEELRPSGIWDMMVV